MKEDNIPPDEGSLICLEGKSFIQAKREKNELVARPDGCGGGTSGARSSTSSLSRLDMRFTVSPDPPTLPDLTWTVFCTIPVTVSRTVSLNFLQLEDRLSPLPDF